MHSRAPPVRAAAVTRSCGRPAAVAGAYSGLVYALVPAGRRLATPLVRRRGPLRLNFGCGGGGALSLAIFAPVGIVGPLAAAHPLVGSKRAIGAIAPCAIGSNAGVDGGGVIG